MQYSNSMSGSAFRILIVLLFFLYIFLSFIKPVSDPDTPWHLKTGEYIVLNKTIPQTDPFSYANDTIPFIGEFILSQYWLAQIIFYLNFKSFGPAGLIIMGASIFTFIIGILLYLLKKQGFYVSLAITGGFAFYVLRSFSGIRPQIFTFLFSVMVIFFIEKYKENKSRKYLLPLPFMLIIWANMHGGFIYGIVIMIIYVVSESIEMLALKKTLLISSGHLSPKQIRDLLILCCASIIASMVNPNTYKAIAYAFTTHSQNLFYFVGEYKSPFKAMQSNPITLIYSFWFYLVVLSAMIIIYIKKRYLTPLLLLLLAVIPALISIRYISLFSIVTTAMFRYMPFENLPKFNKKISRSLDISVLIFIAVLIAGSNSLKHGNIYRFNEGYYYPVSAAEFLKSNKIFGNIFTSYNKSAFILFSSFPESKIYADSRYINEERIRISLRIIGLSDSINEQIENINKLVPDNIGTIRITGVRRDEYNLKHDILNLKNGNYNRRSWKDILNEINAEIIVHEAINRSSGEIYPFIFKLILEDSWKLIYTDGNVMIFVRDIKKFREIIKKYNKPKSLVYDEIINESLKEIDKNLPDYYSSIALALMLKGISDNKTLFFINKSLSIAPDSIMANYCRALHELMKQSKVRHGS
ncbi:MAG: hypothetical protein AB1632_04580 [Nitrospirota bacterium]